MKHLISKYKILRVFAIIFLISLGCSEDFLNYEQRGVQTISSFYKTDNQVLEGLNAVFDQWQNGMGYTYIFYYLALGDECYAGGGARGDAGGALEELNEFTFTPTSALMKMHYSQYYNAIYRANMVIDNTDPNTSNKAIFVAMAKALRAYSYFFLVNTYGDVPLILHEIGAETNIPRTPKSDVYAQMEKDLAEAIAVLPVRSQMYSAYTHLVCKGTAQAMLGKVYLFQKKYDEAAAAFQKIIDSGEYGLYPDYSKVLLKDSEYGVESLWEIPFITTMGYTTFGSESIMGSAVIAFTPRPEYLPNAVYTALDLYPMGWGFFNPRKEVYDAYTNAGDIVRRNANIISPESLQQLGGKYQTPAGFNPYGSDGYIKLRYLPYQSEGAGSNGSEKVYNNGTNVRLIRYADVLLMAAEAYNRKSSPDDSKAQIYINAVRNRVNLAPVTVTGADLFKAIKLERKLELAFEGHRYFDLQRWGDAYEALKNQGKSIPNGSGGYWQNDAAGYKTNKNELMPIPDYEMTVNTGMTQNPGY